MSMAAFATSLPIAAPETAGIGDEGPNSVCQASVRDLMVGGRSGKVWRAGPAMGGGILGRHALPLGAVAPFARHAWH